MPFSFSPIAWLILAGSILAGGLYLVDAIGDRREVKVHARYAEAARLKNEDIAKFNTDDERVSAVREALIAEAVAKAKGVPGQCPATPEQAKALTDIRKAGR